MEDGLEIIFQDDNLVAVNKPNGLLVHRSNIAKDATEFALQMLRDQIQMRVYPVHRLDRKTSGILLFALDGSIAKKMQVQFQNGTIEKIYQAIVRGYFPEKMLVDYPLTNDRGKQQEAITDFRLIKKSELDLPFGKHLTSRYSLVEASPKTGRMHQIRKHLNHLRHPIIGDRPHGCNKQNRLFKERWGMTNMLLHAAEISFTHPVTEKRIRLQAVAPKNFQFIQKILNLHLKL